MECVSNVLSRVVELVSMNAKANVAATDAVTITFLLVCDTPAARLYNFNAKPIVGLWEKSADWYPLVEVTPRNFEALEAVSTSFRCRWPYVSYRS